MVPSHPAPSAHATTSVDVLLLDAEHRQSLACLRAYARAGLRVGAIACESSADWAPSFKSRWCSMSAAVPDFTANPDAFVDAVLSVVDQAQARVLLPAHDGSIQALRSRRAEVERLVALPLASESALDIAVSKSRTLALAAELGIAIPRSVPVTGTDDVPNALREIGLPAVVKPDSSWAQQDRAGVRLSSALVGSVEEAARLLDWLFSVGGRALIQEWLPGRREAVSLFYARGRFWGRVAQVSHREWPVLGGVSVSCETIPLLPDITDQSERLVRAIALEGCSMVEFRRDREGRPVLMEVNPRIGGSVALAIAAGVNFPQMLFDWAMSRQLRQASSYRVGQRLRWLAGDIWNLKCVLEDQGQPDAPPRVHAVATFLADFARLNISLDGVEFSDLRPVLAEIDQIVIRHGMNRVRKLSPKNWLKARKGELVKL